MTTEIMQPIETPLEPMPLARTPNDWIPMLIERGANPDQLGKAFDVYERWQKMEAEKAYWEAMRRAQARMGPIVRTRENKGTGSYYAPFEELNAIIKPIYTEEGFSMTFTEEPGAPEGYVRIVCDVGHNAGHVRRHMGDYPVTDITKGPKGNQLAMTPIQGTGSLKSYARRYLAKDIWNLAEADEDNDGQRANGVITEEQVVALRNLLEQSGASKKKFMEVYNCEAAELFPAARYDEAMKALKGLMERKAKQNGGGGS